MIVDRMSYRITTKNATFYTAVLKFRHDVVDFLLVPYYKYYCFDFKWEFVEGLNTQEKNVSYYHVRVV